MRKKDTHSPPASTPNPVTTTDGAKPSTWLPLQKKTRTAIDALLSLGTDLPVPNTDFNEDVTLVLLAPQPHDANQPIAIQSSIIGTAVKIEDKGTSSKAAQPDAKKKKTFVTVEYKLKWKYVNTTRKFPCEKCRTIFNSQCEVNEHVRMTHPPVQCDMCEKTFDTPAAMVKHRYHH